MLLSTACAIGTGWAWISALSNRQPDVSLIDPNLWKRLTPEGIRRRNIGFRFYLAGVVLFAVGWLLLSAGAALR